MNNPLQKLIAERDRLIGEMDMTIARIKDEQDRLERIDKSIREYEDAIDKLQMFDTMSVPNGGIHVQRAV